MPNRQRKSASPRHQNHQIQHSNRPHRRQARSRRALIQRQLLFRREGKVHRAEDDSDYKPHCCEETISDEVAIALDYVAAEGHGAEGGDGGYDAGETPEVMPAGFVVPGASQSDAEKDGDDAAEEDLGAASDAFDDATGFPERGVLEVDLRARHCGRCLFTVSISVSVCSSE